jgi:ABC-2 type transport system ATP-binding protein
VLRVDCPTEHFKQSVRKVVLEFGRQPPEFPKCPGLVSNRQVGTKLELVLVGFGDEQRRLAESLAPRSLEVIELNLEEAFIEYTRGPRRALPIFVGGEPDAQSDSIQGAA